MARACAIGLVLIGWIGLCLKYVPVPYAWIGVVCFLICFYFVVYAKSSNARAAYLNIGIIILLLTLSEVFFRYHPKDSSDFRYEGSYVKSFVKHSVLGYAPKKDNTVYSKRYYKEFLLYDVKYTMDANGLRRPFISSDMDQDACLLFFGGSFTFGEGVHDHETIPYLVAEKSKYRSYNFGFHGYGPHQMLAAFEQGLVREIIDCKPEVAIGRIFQLGDAI